MRPDQVELDGLLFDAVTESETVTLVRNALEQGAGGRIITPNVDILRRARVDPEVGGYVDDATLIVADGMPLVWASRMAGTPLPERVAGSSLIWSLSYHLGRDGRSIYLLGGEPAPAGAAMPDGARRAAAVLTAGCPGLRVAGCASPEYGFTNSPDTLAATCREIREAKPDVVYVGLGFPKQEQVISLLRPDLPFTWFLGCGAAINFVAGDRGRAPAWMQLSGLEWTYRLAEEPRRLAGRYLRHDAPYAIRLLATAVARGLRCRLRKG
jgi:N-acetylglucosaminyldiphosphoundecaprenol N-acetyl-beta-D-mannosaminyltransferase